MGRKDYEFRFKSGNLIFPVSLEQFKDTAKRLEDIVRKNRGLKADSKIISCEDGSTYTVQMSTLWHDFHDGVLKQRAEYSFNELDSEKWDKSKYIQLSIKPKSSNDSTYITVGVDRIKNPRKILFYGWRLTPKLHNKIVSQFRLFR